MFFKAMQASAIQVIRLLETDYVPNHIEAESYRESLTKGEASIEETAAKISDLKNQISDLEKLMFNYPRIKQMINRRSAPLTLLEFCKRWRRIALGTPGLFVNLMATHSLLPLNAAAITNLWLEKSKILPLDVSISPEYWGIQEEFTRQALEQLGEHIHRIRGLIISVSIYLKWFIPPMSELEASSLKEIYLLPSSMRHPGKLQPGHLKTFNVEKIDIQTSLNWRSFIIVGNTVSSFTDILNEYAPEDILEFLAQWPNIESFSASCNISSTHHHPANPNNPTQALVRVAENADDYDSDEDNEDGQSQRQYLEMIDLEDFQGLSKSDTNEIIEFQQDCPSIRIIIDEPEESEPSIDPYDPFPHW
ncbi:hypothetical protein M422DRAFT_774725 [Sphaerobolus stellatus SS14]|nr:hypothetical protein M422DRAFT_774725 [Sphaerobolus stellatus SS14]